MEKINGICIDGRFYKAVMGECGKQCSFYNNGYLCQIFRELCNTDDCYFRYSPELTDKINDTPQPTKLATVRATGKAIEVTECTDHNNGTVYFLDVNDDDAGPYDYKELDFENT